MNPLVILVLIFVLRGRSTWPPYVWNPPAIPRIQVPKLSFGEATYFDTFRMELVLDRLKMVTEILEQINHISQMGIGETLRGLGDPSALLSAAGPLIAAVSGGMAQEKMTDSD